MPDLQPTNGTRSQSSGARGARRRIRFVILVVLSFSIWAGLQAIKQAEVVNAKNTQLVAIQQRLIDVKETNEQLKLQITRLNDPEYIEQIAKKDHQMVRDGETLFTEPDSDE